MMFVCIIFLHQFIFVNTATYQKPVSAKVWTERCKKNSYVMNDCNWCWCDEDHSYKCKARVCEEVDMFGHFKDTIQELDEGMEGHGSWRSSPTPCMPGVTYQRGDVHCLCDENGNWPHPVCRHLFGILHSIEVTTDSKESRSQICSPWKLYLVGCNACYCPSSGKLDPTLCTKRMCSEEDPVLTHTESKQIKTTLRKDKMLEIYANCIYQKSYTIGCRVCVCLKNNRLVCNECEVRKLWKKEDLPMCDNNVGLKITRYCNLCTCIDDIFMYCTAKFCSEYNEKPVIPMMSRRYRKRYSQLVEAPIDDQGCVPGTSYQRGCGICTCSLENGNKVFQCTVKPCKKSYDTSLEDMARDCVENTTYESNCLICRCDVINGKKYETCMVNNKCKRSLALKKKSLNYLRGYCEAWHVHRKGCNICICLTGGKMMKCTSRLCTAKLSGPMTVDIIPLKQAEDEPCPKGYSYKVGCNVYFCLSNGNALCSTADCSKLKVN